MSFLKNFVLTLSIAMASTVLFAADAGPLVLFDATKPLPPKTEFQYVKGELQNGKLNVTTTLDYRWPTVLLVGPWNLKDYGTLVFELENLDDEEITLYCRIDMPGGDGATGRGTMTETVRIPGKESQRWTMNIPAPIAKELQEKFFAMRGNPFTMRASDAGGFDRSTITELRLFVGDPKQIHHYSVKSITAQPDLSTSPLNKIEPDKFFPMIDKFGQFVHKDWPGKVKDEADLKSRIEKENADINAHPGPEDRSQYGGWTAGKKQEAKGHFYPAKVDGKWWLVDPEGCLFWSHGSDCVIDGNAVTPITDREFYFTELPGGDTPFGMFYGQGNWAPHNYYEGKGAYKTYNFTGANLLRKYGPDWRKIHAELAHKRLKSWGMNTIANWSDASIYLMRKTPYTATVNASCPPIQGSGGYWGKFSDPFHDDFRKNYRRAFNSQKERTANDPWCIGYFVDNEISWGDEGSLAVAALTSPADQPVKIAMVNWLKEKYAGEIGKLNAEWGSDYADWNAILQSTQKPDEAKSKADMNAFYTVIAEEYFRVLSEESKLAAPNKLYLGCRFAWVNDLAVYAAAKYCDVISFNKYQYELDSFRLPGDLDRPCINGEFHFGALDRGMFHTGLCVTESQEARAAAYEKYVDSALRNPLFVGTHWFQYGDQATTGRGDGENYQIGLLDVCDTPYPETIKAVRKIGWNMYQIRSKGGSQ